MRGFHGSGGSGRDVRTGLVRTELGRRSTVPLGKLEASGKMRQFADLLYRYRYTLLAAFLAITAVFGWQLRHLVIGTVFSDLYPENSEAVRILEKYPAFSSPLTVSLAIQVKHGTIWNVATLKKIQQATAMVDLIPGVDHNAVVSIASRKVKYLENTPSGIRAFNLLVDYLPKTPAENAEVRHRAQLTPGVPGTLISSSEDAALVQATFIPSLIDYSVIFERVNRIIKTLTDSDHKLYAAGQPMLTGWVYHYQKQVRTVFILGFVAMVLLLSAYFRNLVGVLVPTTVGIVSGIWGFGIAALLGYNLDPLVILVPMLLIARGLSHSVQMCERYFELYYEHRERRAAVIGAFASLLPPGVVGILCDAAGIFLIAIAPMPLIRKIAFVGGFWSVALILSAIVLTSLLLSVLPPPGNVDAIVTSARPDHKGVLATILRFMSYFSATRPRSAATVLAFLALTVACGWAADHRVIGDPNFGTSILWPDSEYNRAVAEMAHRFNGADSLTVVIEGNSTDIIETSAALNLVADYQRHLERDPLVSGTVSFADYVLRGNRLLHGGWDKWETIPADDTGAAMLSQVVMLGAAPKDFDRLITPKLTAASVTAQYPDHRAPTISRALAWAEDFARKQAPVAAAHQLKLRIASGTLGLLGADNAIITKLEVTTVVYIVAVIFVLSALAYRSVTAGMLLITVSTVAYLITTGVMWLKTIGLDVNTFPVAAIGMGIGIDYNIYLMSRMCEDYRVTPDYSVVVPSSIFTTGKAIFFTATTMVVGIIIWYFLSDLRFDAEMGLLLTAVMLAHVVLALFFQAAAMQLLRPQFVETGLRVVSTTQPRELPERRAAESSGR